MISSITAKVCAAGGWLGLMCALLIGTGMVWKNQNDRAQDRAYWTVSGPPCPRIPAAEVASLPRPLDQTFAFEGRRFWRASGAAACSGLTTTDADVRHYDVCEFNSPRALAVQAGRHSAFFDVGGGPATVTVGPKGEVACVLAARFNGE